MLAAFCDSVLDLNISIIATFQSVILSGDDMKYPVKLLFLLLLAFVLSACQQAAGPEAASTVEMTEEQKAFYFLGENLSRNLEVLDLTAEELAYIQRGMADALLAEPLELDSAVYGQAINEIAQQRSVARAEREAVAAQIHIDKMAAEEGAVTTESGIVILTMVEGTGEQPTQESMVKAHYHGTLRDGIVFDSSVDRGQPFTARLTNVITCWREAISTMKVGGKSKITCPPELAYGTRGSGKIPGGAALTFEVELLEVVEQDG